MQATEPYSYRETYFLHIANKNHYGLLYYAPAGVTAHHEVLPPELLSQYDIKPDYLSFYSVIFTLKSQTYDDFIKARFTRPADFDGSEPFEITRVTVR